MTTDYTVTAELFVSTKRQSNTHTWRWLQYSNVTQHSTNLWHNSVYNSTPCCFLLPGSTSKLLMLSTSSVELGVRVPGSPGFSQSHESESPIWGRFGQGHILLIDCTLSLALCGFSWSSSCWFKILLVHQCAPIIRRIWNFSQVILKYTFSMSHRVSPRIRVRVRVRF